MQQALHYRTWLPIPTATETGLIDQPSSPSITDDHNSNERNNNNLMMVKSMVMENAVIVFGRHGCCMSHVVKRLLLALGVNPAVYEVDNDEDEVRLIDELTKIAAGDDSGGAVGGSSVNRPQFPSVYIGGRLFGGLDQLMGAHISGQLTPLLKKAGALWL